MNENSDEKLDRLFKAARSVRPETSSQEQYFETRVKERIRERELNRATWPVVMWRMAPVFAMVVLILLFASLVVKPERTGDYFAAIVTEEEDDIARF